MIHIVILSDEIDIITDVVAFDNLKQAEKLVHELSAKYGKEHVQRVTARLNEVPAFWGIDCMNAAQQSVQPTIATAALEDSPFETGIRRNAVVASNRNSG